MPMSEMKELFPERYNNCKKLWKKANEKKKNDATYYAQLLEKNRNNRARKKKERLMNRSTQITNNTAVANSQEIPSSMVDFVGASIPSKKRKHPSNDDANHAQLPETEVRRLRKKEASKRAYEQIKKDPVKYAQRLEKNRKYKEEKKKETGTECFLPRHQQICCRCPGTHGGRRGGS